jgi:tRNA/rRNA methyltransferase
MDRLSCGSRDGHLDGHDLMTGAGTDRTRLSLEGGPAVILVEPQLGENIGMAARAMANFGLSELRLVRPRERWLNQKTRAASSGAIGILERATPFDSVEAAIGDLHFLYATTARERGQGKPVVGPPEAAAELRRREAQGEKTGLLFGRERTGLDNQDIALADAILTYPVNPAFASLNLAQAVLIAGYAWMTSGGAPLPFERKTKWPPARREAVLAFFDHLEGELDQAGFFRPAQKRPVMSRNLRNIFHRLSMSEQDVRTLRGVVVRLVEGPRIAKTRKRKGPKQTPKGTRPALAPDQG